MKKSKLIKKIEKLSADKSQMYEDIRCLICDCDPLKRIEVLFKYNTHFESESFDKFLKSTFNEKGTAPGLYSFMEPGNIKL